MYMHVVLVHACQSPVPFSCSLLDPCLTEAAVLDAAAVIRVRHMDGAIVRALQHRRVRELDSASSAPSLVTCSFRIGHVTPPSSLSAMFSGVRPYLV